VLEGVIGIAQISTANTNRDGTGTIGTVATAGAQGTLIELIRVKATGTTTAGMVRLYIHDGANARLLAEISVSAATPSATVQTFEDELTPTTPLVLPSGYSLRASTHNAETFNVFAVGGHY
jgi:hypothetical protein